MSVSGLLPVIAIAAVGGLFLLRRRYAQDVRPVPMNRRGMLALVVAVFAACCVAGAGTALQIAHSGLAGTPPPTLFGAVGRLIERATLLTFVVGAGASGLIGLGLRSGVLDAARAIYHLLMFACGAILAAGFAVALANGAASRET
jgi:hypothetical protein